MSPVFAVLKSAVQSAATCTVVFAGQLKSILGLMTSITMMVWMQ